MRRRRRRRRRVDCPQRMGMAFKIK